MALLLAGTLATGAAAQSRDLPPLPDALACPIDAPVRVASSDTLKRFSALDGCTPDAVIVSPATELPRARAIASAPSDDFSDAMLLATNKRGKRGKRAEPPGARVETATIGQTGLTVIRIAPTQQFEDLEIEPVIAEPLIVEPVSAPVMASAPIPVSTGYTPMTDAAILALTPASYTSPHDGIITAAAARHGVDPLMLHAVITQESRYRSSAVSPVGARGLMQVMPGTGRMLGVRDAGSLMIPSVNVDAGAKLLKQLWGRLNGRFDLVLAAYNAGEGAVRKYGFRIPPYRETQNYVVGVKAIYRKLLAERGVSLGIQ